MTDRPEPGARGDRDAIVTGQEDKFLDTPDDSTPSTADRPFEPTATAGDDDRSGSPARRVPAA